MRRCHRRGAPFADLEWHHGVAPYPASLVELGDAPKTIFARGRADVLQRPVVAVVGTRRSTPYGERVARAVATVLARAGVCVVSGLALGIDVQDDLRDFFPVGAFGVRIQQAQIGDGMFVIVRREDRIRRRFVGDIGIERWLSHG